MNDSHYMYVQRCIDLALNGAGLVAPNPMVGCVIVYKDRIIGEGFHHEFGGHHAEVVAINSVTNKNLLSEATLYVNLEPCSHQGKTPACTDIIIKYHIPRVIIGSRDPFYLVNGKGQEILEASGCEVVLFKDNKNCEELNKFFFTYNRKKRPYILLKWAQSSDGFMDKKRSSTKPQINYISSAESQLYSHVLRKNADAIIIGSNTAINDNPSLTTRKVAGINPLRIVIDRKGRLIKDLNIFDGNAPTLVFSYLSNNYKNAETVIVPKNDDFISALISELYNRNIQSLIVEGGATLLDLFIIQNLWDEAMVFTSDTCFNEGLRAPEIHSEKIDTTHSGNDIVSQYINRKL